MRELADQAGLIVWPGRPFSQIAPDVQRVVRAAALLALTFFGREWLLNSARATINAYRSQRPPKNAFTYLLGCLRNNVYKFGAVGEREEEITAGWFGRLMLPAEEAILKFLPPERAAQTTPNPEPVTLAQVPIEERRAAAADLRRMLAETKGDRPS